MILVREQTVTALEQILRELMQMGNIITTTEYTFQSLLDDLAHARRGYAPK